MAPDDQAGVRVAGLEQPDEAGATAGAECGEADAVGEGPAESGGGAEAEGDEGDRVSGQPAPVPPRG